MNDLSVERIDTTRGAVNSYGDAVGTGSLQFEIVVFGSGGVRTNGNEAGEEIAIP